MNSGGIFQAHVRKEQIAAATPQRYTAIVRAAEALSRRNVDQAITELLNEALARLVRLCYERADDGALCNVDEATGRVLIPLPWARWAIANGVSLRRKAKCFAVSCSRVNGWASP